MTLNYFELWVVTQIKSYLILSFKLKFYEQRSSCSVLFSLCISKQDKIHFVLKL